MSSEGVLAFVWRLWRTNLSLNSITVCSHHHCSVMTDRHSRVLIPTTGCPIPVASSYQYCQNFNVTSTQRLGWVLEMTLQPPPPHKCQQFLKCYLPEFDQILKLGSGEHLERIPTVIVTFVQATYMSLRHLSISAITQLLLARFWPNFWDPISFFGQNFFWPKYFLDNIFL